MIPSKVLMIQDVTCFYIGKIREVRDMEMRDIYSKLCGNRVLREENKIVERKGLMHAIEFPQMFKNEWIKIVLRHIHANQMWLEGGPIRISKRIVHRVSGYPTLDRLKSMWSDAKEVIENNTSVM